MLKRETEKNEVRRSVYIEEKKLRLLSCEVAWKSCVIIIVTKVQRLPPQKRQERRRNAEYKSVTVTVF